MSLSTTKFNKYEFHTETNSLAFARLYAQNLSKQNITTIYEIGADMALAHEVHDFFWTEIQKVKPSVTNVGEAWVGGTEMDFSNLISAALAKNPDMIMSGVAGPPWVSFVQQAQRFNLFSKTKIVGIHLLGSDVTTSFGANYPVGIQGPSWCPFWLNEKPMQDFAQAYLAKTKLYPADITLEFYVAGLAAVAAIEKANSTDADAMIAALETTPFDTPVGTVQFHDYDHQLNLPVWYGSTGYTSDYPIAIGLNMTKYQDDIYPTKDEILALRAAK
jgi:branched-chain amino acid transport system substrate-binding protein